MNILEYLQKQKKHVTLLKTKNKQIKNKINGLIIFFFCNMNRLK